MCINYHCIDIIPQLIPSLNIPEVHIITMITNPTTNRKLDCHRRDIFAQPQFKEDSHQILLQSVTFSTFLEIFRDEVL